MNHTKVVADQIKRPATPSREGAAADSPASTGTATRGRGIQETVIASDGTPTTIRVTSTIARTPGLRCAGQAQGPGEETSQYRASIDWEP